MPEVEGIIGQPTNISANSHDTPAESDNRTLTTAAPAGRPILVKRVRGAAEDVVDGLAHHQALRDASLDVEHGTRLLQHGDDDGVLLVNLADPAGEAHRRVEALKRWSAPILDMIHACYSETTCRF